MAKLRNAKACVREVVNTKTIRLDTELPQLFVRKPQEEGNLVEDGRARRQIADEHGTHHNHKGHHSHKSALPADLQKFEGTHFPADFTRAPSLVRHEIPLRPSETLKSRESEPWRPGGFSTWYLRDDADSDPPPVLEQMSKVFRVDIGEHCIVTTSPRLVRIWPLLSPLASDVAAEARPITIHLPNEPTREDDLSSAAAAGTSLRSRPSPSRVDANAVPQRLAGDTDGAVCIPSAVSPYQRAVTHDTCGAANGRPESETPVDRWTDGSQGQHAAVDSEERRQLATYRLVLAWKAHPVAASKNFLQTLLHPPFHQSLHSPHVTPRG